MKPPESKSPGGPAPGQERERTANEPWRNDNPFAAAAVKTLVREMHIIMAAADRQAGGYRLSDKDHDRLHTSFQHMLRVLAAMYGREVLQ